MAPGRSTSIGLPGGEWSARAAPTSASRGLQPPALPPLTNRAGSLCVLTRAAIIGRTAHGGAGVIGAGAGDPQAA